MQPPINKLWIEEGCISCKVCEDLAPKVFLVDGDEPCVILPDAAKLFESQHDDIVEAAADCPVEVIQFETQDP